MLNSISFRERESLLVISGLVLVAASPVGILVGGVPVRYAILSLGFGLLVWVSIVRLISDPIDGKSLAVLLGIVLVLESLSAINLEDPLNLRMMAYRWICYGMAQLGISLGKGRRSPFTEKSSNLYLMLSIIILIASSIWIVKAVGYEGASRFRGDSEELSPVGVGYAFALLATISVAFLLLETRPLALLLHSAAMLLSANASLTTLSRGPILAFVCVSCFGMLLKIKSSATLVRYGSVLSLAICAFLVGYQKTPYLKEQTDFFISRFDSLQTGEQDESMYARNELRAGYYESVNQWITFGFRGYKYHYPHNFFLESAVRFGAFGILFCLLVFSVSIKATISARIVGGNTLGMVILLTGLFTFLVAQFSLALEYERCLWLFVGYWSVKDVSRSPVHYVSES